MLCQPNDGLSKLCHPFDRLGAGSERSEGSIGLPTRFFAPLRKTSVVMFFTTDFGLRTINIGEYSMTSSLVLGLILGAAILDGFLAGGNVDRIIVQMPAWRRVGVRAWAEYSRKADLGIR